ncbi:MAG: AraC family transcriptional regulator [Planctomycetota bacterium]
MDTTVTTWQERISVARQIIEARLDEDVPLDELARAAHYSPFHFHRLFRALTGETVRDYTRRLRLQRAAHHLVHEDRDILRIALDAGYESHEAFTRAFKSRFDVTPSVFRDERREVLTQRIIKREDQPMDIRIETREPVYVASVRHVGPYNGVGDAWKTLMKWGWAKMIFGKPETFGVCYDDPDVTPAERIRYDACMVVDAKTKPKGKVELQHLPGGTYAVTLHEGSYENLSETYAQMFAQIESGPIDGTSWKFADPRSLEKYLTDPRKVKPEDLRTEIWVPVTKAG